MYKFKKIAALAGVVLLLGMYAATLIFALSDNPHSQALFRASLGCTILVPVILYVFILAAKTLQPSKSPVIDAIIFDVGNVLLDFPWLDFAKKMDISDDAKTFILDNVIDHPLYAECDLGIKSFEVLVDEFCAIEPHYDKEIRKLLETMYTCISPYPYTYNWLSDLRSKGYKLYILSNWSEHAYDKLCENGIMNIEKYMDGATWSFKEHIRKPDREIFEKLLKDYKINADRAVFIDDNPANVNAAKKLGIRSILFKDIADTKSRLKDLGVR